MIIVFDFICYFCPSFRGLITFFLFSLIHLLYSTEWQVSVTMCITANEFLTMLYCAKTTQKGLTRSKSQFDHNNKWTIFYNIKCQIITLYSNSGFNSIESTKKSDGKKAKIKQFFSTTKYYVVKHFHWSWHTWYWCVYISCGRW